MRSLRFGHRWARWATCAIAISICIPALADSKRSLSDCTSFSQTEKGDETLSLSVHNSCKVPIDCKVAWRVVCAPDAPKRRAAHAKTATFTLTEGTEKSVDASASVCGDDAFTLDRVEWGCEPNKD
jgi:hypothetical protein